MKNTNQQIQSTSSHPIRKLSGNSGPEQALRADSASSRAIMNRDAMTTGRHTSAAAGAADRNACASTLGEMTHDDKPAGVSEDRNRKSSTRTDFHVNTLNREELRPLSR